MKTKESVTVHLGKAAQKVHSVVYKGQFKEADLTIYVPREALRELSDEEDGPLALDVTFSITQ